MRKLTKGQRQHYDSEIDTAALVKRCYKLRCKGKKLTPEKLHALCRLTWWGKHWQSTELLALWTLWDKKTNPPAINDPNELVEHSIPQDVVDRIHGNPGIVNFYRVYRNSSLPWIRKNSTALAKLVHSAATLRSDTQARKLADDIQQLDGIPKPSGKPGKMSPASLLTPLVACLDPRSRFPIINKNMFVVKLHKALGINGKSLVDQFNTLTGLIGQYGITDAHMLDVCSGTLAKSVLKKPNKPT